MGLEAHPKAVTEAISAEQGSPERPSSSEGDESLVSASITRFLQDQCGVRWWTLWASTNPHRPDLAVPALHVDSSPTFEYRAVHWFPAFDEDWSVRNGINNNFSRLTEKTGESSPAEGVRG